MNIGAAKKIVAKLQDDLEGLQAQTFNYRRDNDGNLHLIFADGRDEKLPLLNFRLYQLEVQRKLFIEKVKRFFLVRPRRAGKEVEAWNMIIQGALTSPGLYLMVYPSNVRGRIVLWDGAITMPDQSSLKFLDMIPKYLIAKKDEGEMKIILKNGSVIRIIGSDMDINKLRGINARGAAFCEFAFQDPRVYQVMMPVFTQNGGWVILQTTFDGLNHAYQLMQRVKELKDWYCRVDSVETLRDENGNRYVTDEMIDADRLAGMPEFRVLQEYYSIVQLNQQSMFFAVEMSAAIENGRVLNFQPLNKPLHSAWDLGMNDMNAVIQFQIDDDGTFYILNYFEANGKSFNWHLNEMQMFANKHNLRIGQNFAPHDGAKRDYFSDEIEAKPKTIVEYGREQGYHFEIVKRPPRMAYGIEASRQHLYRCNFHLDNTKRLVECLSNFSKDYDEKMNVYKDGYKHDWASHGATSFQTLALAVQDNMISTNNVQNVVYYGQGDTNYTGIFNDA